MWYIDSLFSVMDVLGIFVGAFSGGLIARKARYDITGMWWIALVSGLGGGLLRDMMLQAGPPLALTERLYLPIVLVATGCAALYSRNLDFTRGMIAVVDAVALAAFAVSGTLRTWDTGLGWQPAILLGVLTAIGGGIFRDVMIGTTPMVFRRTEFYGVAALIGCVAIVIALNADLPRSLCALIGFGACLSVRLLSLRYGWKAWEPR